MTSHYQSMHAAVKMLISRITLLHETVQKMEKGVPLLHLMRLHFHSLFAA